MARTNFGRTVLTASMVAAVVAAPAPAAGQQSAELNDAQIAHIAVTANAIDVEMGELAERRASDERVQEFAGRMMTDHTAVNEQAAALAERLGVTPEDNEVSRSLRAGADAAKRDLEALEPNDFDLAYMEREVAYHRAVLEALDETLIPSTSNAELRTLLEQARGAVAAHLSHAEGLREVLGSRS